MTKKHFIALADAIKQHDKTWEGRPEHVWTGEQLRTLADFCASQNPRFNRQRWLDYINGRCGKNGGKVKQTVSA